MQVDVLPYTRLIFKIPIWNDNIVLVSPVIFDAITLELHVDQLIKGTLALAYSIMVMHLCHLNWNVKNV